MIPCKALSLGLLAATTLVSAQSNTPVFTKKTNSVEFVIPILGTGEQYQVDLSPYFVHYPAGGPVLTVHMTVPAPDSALASTNLFTAVKRNADGSIEDLIIPAENASETEVAKGNPVENYQVYQRKEGFNWNRHMYRPVDGGFEYWPMGANEPDNAFVYETWSVDIELLPREAPNGVPLVLSAVENDVYKESIVYKKTPRDSTYQYMSFGAYRVYHPNEENPSLEPWPNSFLTGTETALATPAYNLAPEAGTIALERDLRTQAGFSRPWLTVNLTDNTDIFGDRVGAVRRDVVGRLIGTPSRNGEAQAEQSALAPFEQLQKVSVFDISTFLGNDDFTFTPLYIPNYKEPEYYITMDNVVLDPTNPLNQPTGAAVTYSAELRDVGRSFFEEHFTLEPTSNNILTITRKAPTGEETIPLSTGSFSVNVRGRSETDGGRELIVAIFFSAGNEDIIDYFQGSTSNLTIGEGSWYNLDWLGWFSEEPGSFESTVITSEGNRPQAVLSGYMNHYPLQWLYTRFYRLNSDNPRTTPYALFHFPELANVLRERGEPAASDSPWFYTSPIYFPNLYSYATNSWVYFYEGADNAEDRPFYDYRFDTVGTGYFELDAGQPDSAAD